LAGRPKVDWGDVVGKGFVQFGLQACRIPFVVVLTLIHVVVLRKPTIPTCLNQGILSWSVLDHILSEEQSKDGSDRVSDDGRLTIVQCHHYHQPPSSDLYLSSVGILPPLCYHQNNLHSYHCHYQPTPCAFYHSTTTTPPCSTHVPCSRPITSHTHQSRGHEPWSPQGPARIYIGILRHHPEYESPCYMFILLPYALHNNSLYVYVLSLYKYSSLLYVFR